MSVKRRISSCSFWQRNCGPDISKGCQAPPHQCSDVLWPRLCITLSFPFTPRTSPAAQKLQIKIKALIDSKSSYSPALGSNSALASHRHQGSLPTAYLSQEEWLWDMEHQWLLSQLYRMKGLNFISEALIVKAIPPKHIYFHPTFINVATGQLFHQITTHEHFHEHFS